MNTDKTLATELLRQNGSATDQAPEKESEMILEAIRGDRRRLGRWKRTMWIYWALVPTSYVAAIVLQATLSGYEGPLGYVVSLAVGFVPIVFLIAAIVATIDVFRMGRSIRDRELQARLASIEGAIRRLSETEQ